jgi:hypothetical protein
MNEHSLNSQNPFIRGYYIDTAICDDIVNHIQNIQLEKDDTNFRNYYYTWVEKLPEDLKKSYINSIIECIETYKSEFEFCYKDLNLWTLKSGIKIQKYDPGNYYSVYHSETSGYITTLSRNLVFMTYLNDISNGGGTEFFHQKLKVMPEKGLTLIWPTDWTHVHKGIVSETEEKYITTGWFVYDLTGGYTGFLY